MQDKEKRSYAAINYTILSLLIFIPAALCACTSEPAITPSPTPAFSPTPSATPTELPSPTATFPPTRTPRLTEVPLLIHTDITYTYSLQPEVKSRALDIYAPVEMGDWPVIILAHGFQQTKEAFVRMGSNLAREGAVVFVLDWPAWSGISSTGDGSVLRERTETFNCAVRFTRTKSLDYTQTPERVAMVGYSLGGWFGLLTALAGEELDTQWKVYEAVNGVPSPQVSCVIEDGTAHVDAFVGYGGAYTTVNQEEIKDADFLRIVNIETYIGENPNLCIRAIQGIYDNMYSKEAIQSHEELITTLADTGYDAQWLEVDGGHGFSPSGELWDHNRRVIMDAARP